MAALGIQHYWLYVSSCLLLNITPGQDTFYILGRTLAQGKPSGLASVFGIATGCLIHTVAATLGLSAIVAASPVAFAAVKWLGAGYLVFLGLRMMLAQPVAAGAELGNGGAAFWPVYRQGVLTNVLNPKVILFFLAFVPQFIAAESPHKPAAFLLLGSTFVTTGTLWCLGLVGFASWANRWLGAGTRASPLLNRVTGCVFVGLGLRLAMVAL